MSARISNGAANANVQVPTAIHALNLASVSIGKVKTRNLAMLKRVLCGASNSPLDEASSKKALVHLLKLQGLVSARQTNATVKKLKMVHDLCGMLGKAGKGSPLPSRAPSASVAVALSDKDKKEKTIAENRSILAKFGRYGGDFKHIQLVSMSSKTIHDGPDVVLRESPPASPRRQ